MKKFMEMKYRFPPKQIKPCDGCGIEYKANVGQKYHSPDCKLAHYKANGLGEYRKGRQSKQ